MIISEKAYPHKVIDDMNQLAATILDQALALNEKDRWFITEKLLASLSPDLHGELTQDEWLAELDRRVKYLEEHPESGMTLEEWKSSLKDD